MTAKHELNIIAYLNLEPGTCAKSREFKEQFIDNEHRLPEVKEIPVKIEIALTEPEVILLNGHHPLRVMKGEFINAVQLDDFILQKLGL